MRVFLDANILFSAAKTAGAVRELLGLLQKARHDLVVDDYVVIEARRNLVAKGPDAVSQLDRLLPGCHHNRAWASAEGIEFAQIGWLPDKDRPVLAAAIHLRCDAVLTGDRTHFGANYGKTFGGVMIHSPRSLAEALLSKGE